MKNLMFLLALIISLFIFDYLLLEITFFFINILKNHFWIIIVAYFLGFIKFADVLINIASLPILICTKITSSQTSKKITIVLLVLNFTGVIIGSFGANYSIGANIIITLIFGSTTYALILNTLSKIRTN